MTRFFVAATAALALFAVGVQEASALTSSTRRCIAQKRAEYRSNLAEARADLLGQFQADYQGCFGPDGAACAKLCQDTQTSCQDPARKATQKCINDNNDKGEDDPNYTACDDTFDVAVAACNEVVDDAEAVECAKEARLARFACTQKCAADNQAAIDQCNFAFGDCVQACASKRN